MIRHLYREEGWSKRQIARELGIDRKTVRRYLKKDGMPNYHRRAKYPSILDSYDEYIRGRLKNYPKITAEKIYRELAGKGFKGSYRIVAYWVSKLREKEPHAFLRYETKPGEYAQVDWGDFGYIDYYGKKKKLYCFSIVLCWSISQYIEFTVSQDLQTLERCHLHAFEYFGGVPEKILYDNMKTVALFHIDDKVKFNLAFIDFAGHFGFLPKVCDVDAPHQKGKVEKSIGYIRTSFFIGEEFRDLNELNEKARRWMDNICNTRVHGTTHEIPFERLKEERKSLRPLPDRDYRICKVEYRNVGKDCYFPFENNQYSVPHKYAGKRVTVEVYEQEIKVYYETELIATHRICPLRGRRIKDESHFESLPYKRRNGVKKYEDLFAGYGEAGKEFVRGVISSSLSNPYYHLSQIAKLCEFYSGEAIRFALERANRYRAYEAKTFKNILSQYPNGKEGVNLNLVVCSQCTDVEERPLEYYEMLCREG
ncbi:MAG: IS21 family transposase [bacterium]|nr:IS21 family transposase [bacterium]